MKIAGFQMKSVPGDVGANLDKIAAAARAATEKGASILVVPELALTGYGVGKAVRETAQTLDGDQIAGLAATARETGLTIVAGFAERDGDIVRNSAVVVDGEALPIVYRKCNLYGPYERGLFEQAKPAAVTFEKGGLTFGLLICYDVEFPENMRRLARAGVDAVLVPTALPTSDHDAFIARQMVPVRAFENQVFLAYVNHCGADERFAYAGLSSIVAPDGTLLAKAGGDEEALIVAELTPSRYADSAEANSYLADLNI
ncbi:hydrolase [Aliihoeflea aestuarii]|jgi:5-aminopentanamidase|uniref:carbon-nitrogen hydrolase family protein n=1 Tax=Aliihoeflea aestuarii TaxID=453840 RepID=UPI002093BCEC|nr:carbon-nitrogen hydrolase family protein [Aliihoeflea aestuarii]MCO6391088.1 hydrolase [Aliihoeflea aestuarii]